MVSFLSFFFLAVAVVVNGSPMSTTPAPRKSERELRRDLFYDYDKYARPVIKQSTSVPVKISMTPLAVKSLSVKTQMIILDSWVMMTWTDEYLTWDPAEYDNITQLHVSPSQIWRPDVSLYTASPDTALFPTVFTQAILYNSGTLIWVPPFTINSRCPTPFRKYEEYITCNIKLGSWTYSGKELDLELATEKVDLTNFQDYNREWKLLKLVSNRESKFYPCCPDAYPSVNFNITMKRRSYSIKTDISD